VWHQAALIYNPMAGQQREQRLARVTAALAVLRKHGVPAESIATLGPGTAGRQAQEAVARGCDAVLACGGDGTVHEVLQGMVGSSAALGVIPLGTANSLAADLGIPRNTAAAARLLLGAEPTTVAVARMECQDDDDEQKVVSRYFIVTAGIGPDAHVFYALKKKAKYRLGYLGYTAKAISTWLTYEYPMFEVEFTPPGGELRREHVSQVLAVRIENFGGILRRLAPGAALTNPSMRLVLFKTRSRVAFLRYMSAAVLGWQPRVPGVELVDAETVTCRSVIAADEGSVIRAEADGELLGRLPATIRMAPAAVKLLMPTKKR
jgi:YegS/Rv2252/BmrU family lipid kinase